MSATLRGLALADENGVKNMNLKRGKNRKMPTAICSTNDNKILYIAEMVIYTSHQNLEGRESALMKRGSNLSGSNKNLTQSYLTNLNKGSLKVNFKSELQAW